MKNLWNDPFSKNINEMTKLMKGLNRKYAQIEHGLESSRSYLRLAEISIPHFSEDNANLYLGLAVNRLILTSMKEELTKCARHIEAEISKRNAYQMAEQEGQPPRCHMCKI